MLFGEKYGEVVRVVIADEMYSKELCGGTHVRSTGNIGYCKIISETAVAAGIRRIEAVTGDGVTAYIQSMENALRELAGLTNSPFGNLKGVHALISENKNSEGELNRLYAKEIQNEKHRLKSLVKNENGVNTLFAITTLENAEHIKKTVYDLRNETDNLFCVLGADLNGKANITIIISDNLVAEKNLDAGKMVRELGKFIDGGGGGQKFFASAGGKNPGGLKAVMDEAGNYLKNISQ